MLLHIILIVPFSLMQSEDDFSLSGIALTALYFDGNSRVLISGDQSGTVKSTLDRFFLLLSNCFSCIMNTSGPHL